MNVTIELVLRAMATAEYRLPNEGHMFSSRGPLGRLERIGDWQNGADSLTIMVYARGITVLHDQGDDSIPVEYRIETANAAALLRRVA